MSILKKAWNKAKKAVLKATTDYDKNREAAKEAAQPQAQMGPAGSGDARARAVSDADRRRQRRGARGRDSTIIAGRSELGSRTLLG